MSEPLGKHIAPRLGRERLAQQWEAIAPRVGARKSRPWAPMALAFAGALSATVLFVVVRRAQPPATTAATLVDGTWLESAPSGPSPAVVLADGSRVALGAMSRLRLTKTAADDVRLDLERGRVDVQATHRAGRSFLVAARGVEVHVVGTRFSVEADGAVRVRVEEGRVQVHDGSGDRFVAGGEEWVQQASPDIAPAQADDRDDASTGTDSDDDGGAPLARRSSSGRGNGVADAKKLLGDAQRAVAQGRNQDAARLFDAIRRDHPHDPRAGLAAFELGRLRLDTLGDPAGAEEAFRDAIRLARDSGLRDDAEARRIEALDKMGSRAACGRARATYLATHPNGVHRAEVTGWCGGT